MMKSVPPKTTSVATSGTATWSTWNWARKGGGEFHRNEMIQNKRTSQDQRGTNRPVGNVKRKAPRPIHAAPEMRLSKVESRGGDWVPAQSPKSVFTVPVPPKSTSSSETNRPIHSSDLRQKISRPRPQGRREITTSRVTKEAA